MELGFDELGRPPGPMGARPGGLRLLLPQGRVVRPQHNLVVRVALLRAVGIFGLLILRLIGLRRVLVGKRSLVGLLVDERLPIGRAGVQGELLKCDVLLALRDVVRRARGLFLLEKSARRVRLAADDVVAAAAPTLGSTSDDTHERPAK